MGAREGGKMKKGYSKNWAPFAPTFTPTEEEFREPLRFIKKIAEHGMRTGIVKIIPPASWKPDFNIQVKQKFETYRQALHLLERGESFDSGDDFDQSEYREYSSNFQADWFKKHPETSRKFNRCLARGDRDAASQVLENEYWRIVERESEEEVCVDYANNMDTKMYGTPFQSQRVERSWDLTTLLLDKESILQKVGNRIAGVTTPWLYFGCMFATFCWHVEDHFLYSLNYMHHGASKVWYGVPEVFATKFEELVKQAYPERFIEDPDLLHQLVKMVSPIFLRNQGVNVFKAIQQEGEIIVTYPRAYHGGFSHGWNCAEAVNFATMDWLPHGRNAVQSYMDPKSGRAPTFSHDRLLWDVCKDVADAFQGLKTVSYYVGRQELAVLCSELEHVARLENLHRSKLRSQRIASTTVGKPWDGEPFQCVVCKSMHYFSFCICSCGTKSAVTSCLAHALDTKCGCGLKKKLMCIQVPDKDYMNTLAVLQSKLKSYACSTQIKEDHNANSTAEAPAPKTSKDVGIGCEGSPALAWQLCAGTAIGGEDEYPRCSNPANDGDRLKRRKIES